MGRPVVKICGVSTETEITRLAEAGVDFFGLVVEVPSPWTVSRHRAKELAGCSRGPIRATLVTKPGPPDKLEQLIRETGVRAIQLGMPSLPKHVEQLRRSFRHEDLVILQEIPYGRERFWKEGQVDEYLAAGADFILIDRLEKADGSKASPRGTIPEDSLVAFRQRHPKLPLLVAGGITAENALALMAASGAVGIDVCSSVHHEGLIRQELVARLMEQLRERPESPGRLRPSLRSLLDAAEPGSHVIAYLTLGDPQDRFLEVAHEVLEAGALTLELGFPYAEAKEGATLLASHHRALKAGVNTSKAMELWKSLACQHPQMPLIAVVQWPAIASPLDRDRFLEGLADAGAAAILPVGLPLWQLPAFAASVDRRGLQTVLPCAPNASRKAREITFRHCSGCLYVPRGRLTGGASEFAVADFCSRLAGETELPFVVGIGVKTAEDVAEICRTPAKAAAVGSALVEHITRGGSAGELVRRLLARCC